MPKLQVEGPVTSKAALSCAPCSGSDHRTMAGRCIYAVTVWIARSGQRRALRELATLNNRYLEDIGVSKDEALREASKRFWRQ